MGAAVGITGRSYAFHFRSSLLGTHICSKRRPICLLSRLQRQLHVARIGNKRIHTLLAAEKQSIESVHVIGETCR